MKYEKLRALPENICAGDLVLYNDTWIEVRHIDKLFHNSALPIGIRVELVTGQSFDLISIHPAIYILRLIKEKTLSGNHVFNFIADTRPYCSHDKHVFLSLDDGWKVLDFCRCGLKEWNLWAYRSARVVTKNSLYYYIIQDFQWCSDPFAGVSYAAKIVNCFQSDTLGDWYIYNGKLFEGYKSTVRLICNLNDLFRLKERLTF